jgi:hypothetical protein
MIFSENRFALFRIMLYPAQCISIQITIATTPKEPTTVRAIKQRSIKSIGIQPLPEPTAQRRGPEAASSGNAGRGPGNVAELAGPEIVPGRMNLGMPCADSTGAGI